ncbi:hypothetical protein [Flaviaesturariibacter aridisoli]|uniref:Uncharacterized protein n=1 Tax=Flaviaesturariibacter aridisoli TaxID=2545761 RepID=A0A4V2WM09_9BACT|nr:hypothetical protein [Flaviaesturariibacter aridisoli]TCZ65862.1 hypothetical protein E0486_17010 [Flaviaesturariibacter aridisoli]
MNAYAFIFASSFSIIIAVLLGAFRMHQVARRYIPFLLFLLMGLLNEIASEITGRIWQTNAPNCDIYTLVDSLVLIWMFYEWRLFRKTLAYVLGSMLIVIWVSDTLIWGNLMAFSSRFSVSYALLTVLMSVQYINHLIVTEQRLTLKNPDFLICICLVLFYTASAIVEIFWFFGFDNNPTFVGRVYIIIPVVNLLVNLTYALAVLWIPRKPAFITLS